MEGKGKKSMKKKPVDLNTDTLLLQLGNRIKNLRIKQGYSNYETFAFEHDIPRAQFGRYEKGQDLRFSSLIKLLNAFNMTLEEFFSEGFE